LSGVTSNTTATLPDGSPRDMNFNRVGPDYFETLGIPLVAGRVIDARDRTNAPAVVVINEAAAAAAFGAQPALGRSLKIFNRDSEIVGVVRDAKAVNVRQAAAPTVFLPYEQGGVPLTLGALIVIVRTAVEPVAVMGPLRAAVADIDRDVPVSRMKTQDDQIQETLGTDRRHVRNSAQ